MQRDDFANDLEFLSTLDSTQHWAVKLYQLLGDGGVDRDPVLPNFTVNLQYVKGMAVEWGTWWKGYRTRTRKKKQQQLAQQDAVENPGDEAEGGGEENEDEENGGEVGDENGEEEDGGETLENEEEAEDDDDSDESVFGEPDPNPDEDIDLPPRPEVENDEEESEEEETEDEEEGDKEEDEEEDEEDEERDEEEQGGEEEEEEEEEEEGEEEEEEQEEEEAAAANAAAVVPVPRAAPVILASRGEALAAPSVSFEGHRITWQHTDNTFVAYCKCPNHKGNCRFTKTAKKRPLGLLFSWILRANDCINTSAHTDEKQLPVSFEARCNARSQLAALPYAAILFRKEDAACPPGNHPEPDFIL